MDLRMQNKKDVVHLELFWYLMRLGTFGTAALTKRCNHLKLVQATKKKCMNFPCCYGEALCLRRQDYSPRDNSPTDNSFKK